MPLNDETLARAAKLYNAHSATPPHPAGLAAALAPFVARIERMGAEMKATKEHYEAAERELEKWRNDHFDKRPTYDAIVDGALSIVPDPAELQARVAELEAAAMNAADERDRLKAQLAAMPEPVVIDEALATRVLIAFNKDLSANAYGSMLSALREVLGERVVVKEPEADKLRERAEKAERELAELRAENERLKAKISAMPEPVVIDEALGESVAPAYSIRFFPNDGGELKAIENRCCADSDYGHEGVHPVEVRIQTQRRKIVELQKKLEEAEAARKAADDFITCVRAYCETDVGNECDFSRGLQVASQSILGFLNTYYGSAKRKDIVRKVMAEVRADERVHSPLQVTRDDLAEAIDMTRNALETLIKSGYSMSLHDACVDAAKVLGVALPHQRNGG